MQLPPSDTIPSAPAPERGNRRTLLLLIGGGVAALLVIAIGVGILAWQLLGSRPNSIPQLIAGDTQIYAAITPNLSDLPNIDRLRKAFPEALDYQNNADTNDQLVETMGVTFNDDIAPWIGTEMAAAVSGLPFDQLFDSSGAGLDGEAALAEQAQVVLVLTSRDEKAAQAFLDKQRQHREGQGQQFASSEAQGATIYAQQGGDPSPIAAFGIVRGNVVFATGPDLIAAIAARDPDGKDTLAASARFQQVLASLSADRLGFVFVDGAPIARALQANSDQVIGQLQGDAADQLREQLKSVDALQGIGLSLSVLADGVAFDALASFDRAGLSQATLDQISEATAPVSADRTGRVSAETLAAFSFRLPSTFGKQIRDGINSVPGADAQIASVEQETGLDLDRDLLSWLQGEATIVLLPGEEIMGSTTPVSGYFALKPNDRGAAEDGMGRIVKALDELSGGQIGLHEEQLGGVAWQVVGTDQEVAAGYGFVGDDLVIGVGPSTLAAAASPAAPLSGDQAYQAGLKALPAPNGGLMFVNLPAVLGLAQDLGGLDAPTVTDRLAPFKAITIAGSPGMDDKGVARGRLYLVISGE
ncbi:DUF3352 domain-containing protein [Oscillochloris sp. ZM17-4]|uniref:DUF3352 domain-containing protein n=1 Tax=Oscillochloris sp. ZM17-4 TaxID=2866714 RepID=UPI001C73DFF4|nr:DUF3352 domain-containing protein [Oscillochloris sp. ZM17-4]MBX0329599.1 DUF3352 domain-containing protein [Oscillochloris sp. ZM17-4]